MRKKRSHVYNVEERRMAREIHRLYSRKYKLRECWLEVDIKENILRNRLRDMLAARGFDYDHIIENNRGGAKREGGARC